VSLVNSLRYGLYFTSETIIIFEKTQVVNINQTQYFPFFKSNTSKIVIFNQTREKLKAIKYLLMNFYHTNNNNNNILKGISQERI
jgi:hypothetical protein